jgi:hypothetical protein
VAASKEQNSPDRNCICPPRIAFFA